MRPRGCSAFNVRRSAALGISLPFPADLFGSGIVLVLELLLGFSRLGKRYE
jgi:hypothetical protein